MPNKKICIDCKKPIDEKNSFSHLVMSERVYYHIIVKDSFGYKFNLCFKCYQTRIMIEEEFLRIDPLN